MTINNKIKTALYSTLILFGATMLSCKKFLVQEPNNRIAIADIFKDFEGARTTLIACYDNLLSADMYGRTAMLYPDLVGGNIKYTRITNQYLFNTYTFVNDPVNNDLDLLNLKAYNTIYRANSVLENVNNAADATQLQKNRMKADAYLIRALSHFTLVTIFAQMPNFTANASHAGIALRLQNTSGIGTPSPISTVAQVYASIGLDIDSAKRLYANSVSIYNFGADKTWLSLNAAKAFESRVKLYTEKNADVVAITTDIIANGGVGNIIPNAQYENAWRGRNMLQESIFELNYGDRTGGSLGDYFNPLAVTNYQFAATNDLLNIYDPNDVRRRTTMFTPYANTFGSFLNTRKWSGIRDSANNIRMFRLSEIYLNRAEAYAKIGDATALQLACNDLNRIRTRGLPTAVNIVPTIGQAALITEILLERRRELCFEGQLFFDIARNKQNLTRADCSASINCGLTYPSIKYAVPYPAN